MQLMLFLIQMVKESETALIGSKTKGGANKLTLILQGAVNGTRVSSNDQETTQYRIFLCVVIGLIVTMCYVGYAR